jgi:hypothetical protein
MSKAVKIPPFVISVVSEVLAETYDDIEFNRLFDQLGSGVRPSDAAIPLSCRARLEWANHVETVDPLTVLGMVLKQYLDTATVDQTNYPSPHWFANRDRICYALNDHGLNYLSGGKVLADPFPKEFIVGEPYFMLWYPDRQDPSTRHSLLLDLNALVFVGKNLGLDDRPDERETFYFQDARSYCSYGTYPNLSAASQHQVVKLFLLHRLELDEMVDGPALSKELIDCAERRANANERSQSIREFDIGDLYFRISYADSEKHFLVPEPLVFVGKSLDLNQRVQTWHFQDVASYCKLGTDPEHSGRGSSSRVRLVRVLEGELQQIVSCQGLSDEVLACIQRRSEGGQPS